MTKSTTVSIAAAVLMALLPLLSCGGNGEPVTDPIADPVTAPPADVVVPGTITGPAGDTLTAGPGERVLIYFWIPLNLEIELEQDLMYLASLGDSTLLVVPVQADPESRNLAQTQVNGLGVSLTVYLADPQTMSALDVSMLPSAVLLSPGGGRVEEFGFGAPARLLAAP